MTEQQAEELVSIENNLAEIGTVMSAFERFADGCDVSPAVATRFNVIFDEMLSNIILYGYPDQQRHEIDVAMQRQGGRLSVTITDGGVPFDPLSAASPNDQLPIEEREIGGLGIHLVRNLVHDIQYRRENEQNILTLIQELD